MGLIMEYLVHGMHEFEYSFQETFRHCFQPECMVDSGNIAAVSI